LCVAFAGAEFAFSIFDNEGNGIDGIDLGNLLRALNLNPTNATIEKLGGTKKKGELLDGVAIFFCSKPNRHGCLISGEKKIKFDEFLPIFSQCKKDKDQGCFEDFNECLKLYDKEENGKMLLAELTHTLQSLGNYHPLCLHLKSPLGKQPGLMAN
jgi:myosin light chain 6